MGGQTTASSDHNLRLLSRCSHIPQQRIFVPKRDSIARVRVLSSTFTTMRRSVLLTSLWLQSLVLVRAFRVMTSRVSVLRADGARLASTATILRSAIELAEPSVTVQDNRKSLRETLHVPASAPLPAQRPRVVGHRGALYDELENTREGFLRCVELGADAIELDVFVLKDGTIVVFHGGGTDEFPGDLTNYCVGKDGASILDLTFPQTQKLEFNPYFLEFGAPMERIRSARIPTLEEVLLDLKDKPIEIKVELKGPDTTVPVLELVNKLGMMDQVSYSSFAHERIRLVRELHPECNEDGSYLVRTGALFSEVPMDYLQQAQAAGASEVHLRYDTCTVERIREIRNAGMSSMAWFSGPIAMDRDWVATYWDIQAEDDKCYRTLMASGVDQVCCNRPDVAMNIVNEVWKKQATALPM